MSNVRVAVRVRPLTKREEEQGAKIVVAVEGDNVRVTNLKVPSYQEHDSRARLRQFIFDFCYWSAEVNSKLFASQQMIYEDLGTKVLDAVFEGFNACVLAYGQSGSGKTYTMMGYNGDLGLTPRICQGLFDRMTQVKDKRITFRTEVSFLEIYNERVGDLLRTAPCRRQKHALRVREHPKLGPCVQDLSKHVVTDFNAVQALIERGIQNRSVAATKMHDHSSRSHAIFTINFTQARVDEELPSEVVSKIHLVDLAGSERATVHMSKIRLKEGANINKSLVALGGVICALAEKSLSQWSLDSMGSTRSPSNSAGESLSVPSSPMGSPSRGQQPFVPYRDSVLTWLLKDSLGGNSKTIMVATISPASTAYNETISTLRYIQRAKRIVNKPVINEDPNVKLIRELRAEIARLREMLSNAQNAGLLEQPTESNMPVAEIIIRNQDKAQELTRSWIEKWHYFQKQVQELSCKTCIHRSNLGSFGECGTPYLVGVSDLPSTGVHIFYLKEGEMIIGNGNENGNAPDIILMGEKIATKHCRLNVEEGTTTITPINGTVCFLNGNSLSSPAKLNQGDVVQLGNNNTLRFVDPSKCMNMLLKGNYNCSDALENCGNSSGLALMNEPSLQIQPSKVGMLSEGLEAKILAKCSDLHALESFNKLLEMKFNQSVAQCSICSQLHGWTAPQLKNSSEDSVMGDTEGSSNNETNNPDLVSDNEPNVDLESGDKNEVEEYDDWSDADDFSYFAFHDNETRADQNDEIEVENSERETYSRSIDYLTLPVQSLISRRLSPIQECPSTRTPSPATEHGHPVGTFNATSNEGKPEKCLLEQAETSTNLLICQLQIRAPMREIKHGISCDSLDTDSLDDLDENPVKPEKDDGNQIELVKSIFPKQPSEESTETREIPSTSYDTTFSTSEYISETFAAASLPVPKAVYRHQRRSNSGHETTSSSEDEREFWQVRRNNKPNIPTLRNGSMRSLNRDMYTSSSEDESYQAQLGKPRTKSFKSNQRFEQIVLENKRKKRRKTATKKPKLKGYPPMQIPSVQKLLPDPGLSPPPLPKLDFGYASTKESLSQTNCQQAPNSPERTDLTIFQGNDALVRSEICSNVMDGETEIRNPYFSLQCTPELDDIVPSDARDAWDGLNVETCNIVGEENHDEQLPNGQLLQDMDTSHESFEYNNYIQPPLDCSDFNIDNTLENHEGFAECSPLTSHTLELYKVELDQLQNGAYDGTEYSDFVFEPLSADRCNLDDSPDTGLSPQGSSERSGLTCWSTIATAGQHEPPDQLHINMHAKARETGLFASTSSLWGQSWPSCDSLTMVYMGPEWGSTETNMIASIHSLDDLDSDFSEGRQEALERFVAKSMKARQDSPRRFRNAFVSSSNSIVPYDGSFRNSNETFTICSTDDPMNVIWEQKTITTEPILDGQVEVHANNWTNETRPYKDLWTIHSYSMDDLQSHTSCLCKGLHDDAGNTSTGSTCAAEVSTQTESDSGIQTDATVQSDATQTPNTFIAASTQSAETCTNAICQTDPLKTEVHVQTDPVCTDTGCQTSALVSDGSTQNGCMECKSTQSVLCCKEADQQTELNCADANTNTELKISRATGTQTDLFRENEAQTSVETLEKMTTECMQQSSCTICCIGNMALQSSYQKDKLALEPIVSNENNIESAKEKNLVLEAVFLPEDIVSTETVLSDSNCQQEETISNGKYIIEPVFLDKKVAIEQILPVEQLSVERENVTPEFVLSDAAVVDDATMKIEEIRHETTITHEKSEIEMPTKNTKLSETSSMNEFVKAEMLMNGKRLTRTVLSSEKVEPGIVPDKDFNETSMANGILMLETAVFSEKLAPETVLPEGNLIPETAGTEVKGAFKTIGLDGEAAPERILPNGKLKPDHESLVPPDRGSSKQQISNENTSTIQVPMCQSGIYIGFHGIAHRMQNLDMKISFNDAACALLEFNGKIAENNDREDTLGSECPVKIQSGQMMIMENNDATDSKISEHTKDFILAPKKIDEKFVVNDSDERFEAEDNNSVSTCTPSSQNVNELLNNSVPEIERFWTEPNDDIKGDNSQISTEIPKNDGSVIGLSTVVESKQPKTVCFCIEHNQQRATEPLTECQCISSQEQAEAENQPLTESYQTDLLELVQQDQTLHIVKPCETEALLWHKPNIYFEDSLIEYLEGKFRALENTVKTSEMEFKELLLQPFNGENRTQGQSFDIIHKNLKCIDNWKCDKQPNSKAYLESAIKLSPVEIKSNIYIDQNQSEPSCSISDTETSEEEYYKLPLVIVSKGRNRTNKYGIPKHSEKNWIKSANILARESPKKKCHKSKLRESASVPELKQPVLITAKNELVPKIISEQKSEYDAKFQPNENMIKICLDGMDKQEKISSAEVQDSKNDTHIRNKCKHNITCTCDPQQQLPVPVSKLNSDTEQGENLPDDIIQLLRECRAVRKKAWKEIALAHQQLSISSSSQRQQICAIHQIKSFEGS